MHGLAEGAARRRRSAQPGAQRLLRIHADGLRRPDAVEPWLDDAERALAAVPDGSALPGLTPRTCVRCRRPSPSTGPRSRRPEAMRPARRSTPGAHSTWPVPTTISRGGAAGFLGLAAWAKGDVEPRWRRSRRRWPACAGRQPRRRAERHRRARRPVARGRPAEQGAPALERALRAGRGTRRARGARHRRAARGTERDRRRDR